MPNDPLPRGEPPATEQAAMPPTPPPAAGTRHGFSADELSAAARVIEHQVRRATARPAPPRP